MGNGMTELMEAAAGGSADDVRTILAKGCDVDARDKHGKTALMWAAEKGHSEIVRMLAAGAGANVDAQDKNGWTALMWAAKNGDPDTIQNLVNAGANMNLHNKHGETALMWVVGLNNPKAVGSLMDAGVDVGKALIVAVRHDRTDMIRVLTDKNSNVNVNAQEFYGGKTALMFAVDGGQLKHVEILIAAGANVNLSTPENGQTALIAAAFTGRTDILRALLTAETVNVDRRDKKEVTALMWAAHEGHIEAVEILKEAGANVDAQDKDDMTALMWAALEGHTEAVKILKEVGANVDAQDKDDMTALMWAALKGHTEVVSILAEAGANVDAQDKKGVTALMLAARLGHPKIVRILIEKGADLTLTVLSKGRNQTALIVAEKYGHADIVRQLLAARAGVDARDHRALKKKKNKKKKKKERKTSVKGDKDLLDRLDDNDLPADRPKDIRRLLGDDVTPAAIGIGSAALLLFGFIGYRLWKRATKPRRPEVTPEEPTGADLV